VLEFSGPAGSGKTFLASGPAGEAILTWFEPVPEERAALKVAIRRDGAWSAPRTVAEHDRFFVNWADFPSLVVTTDGRWVTHWLEKTAARPYAYHVMLSTSTDEGATWSTPIRAHADTSSTEHGFAALSPRPDGGVDMVWLDGQMMTGEHAGTMQVRFGSLLPDGSLAPEVVLDDRTCECCQSRLARTTSGLVATYRDRSEEEVRDIGVVRLADGQWQPPTLVASDGWVHRACPVNGPGLDAQGDRVGLAWYTQADSLPRVLFAWSTDGGASFDEPVRIDAGSPVGRPDLVVEDDGSALVAWLEGTDETGAEWRMVRVSPSGEVGPAQVLHRTSRARNTGFARMVRAGPDLLVSVTAVGDTGGVRVVRVSGERYAVSSER
jgi:hypothetical protein